METESQGSSVAKSSQAIEQVMKYFENNQEAESFVGILEVNGNVKVLSLSLKCAAVIILF